MGFYYLAKRSRNGEAEAQSWKDFMNVKKSADVKISNHNPAKVG